MEILDNDMTQIQRCELAGNGKTTKYKKYQFLMFDKRAVTVLFSIFIC